jgi:hypothetical protein
MEQTPAVYRVVAGTGNHGSSGKAVSGHHREPAQNPPGTSGGPQVLTAGQGHWAQRFRPTKGLSARGLSFAGKPVKTSEQQLAGDREPERTFKLPVRPSDSGASDSVGHPRRGPGGSFCRRVLAAW